MKRIAEMLVEDGCIHQPAMFAVSKEIKVSLRDCRKIVADDIVSLKADHWWSGNLVFPVSDCPLWCEWRWANGMQCAAFISMVEDGGDEKRVLQHKTDGLHCPDIRIVTFSHEPSEEFPTMSPRVDWISLSADFSAKSASKTQFFDAAPLLPLFAYRTEPLTYESDGNDHFLLGILSTTLKCTASRSARFTKLSGVGAVPMAFENIVV